MIQSCSLRVEARYLKKNQIKGVPSSFSDDISLSRHFPIFQPDDRGVINNIPVLQVKRKGKDAVHFLTENLDPGTTVTCKVDWNRRWDHMQQHSGQHLITAIVDSLFGFKTTSWWLGELVSHIELGKYYKLHYLTYPSFNAD